MPTKIGNISEMELKQVPLPTGFSKQYAPVSHGYIIDTVKNLLDQKNYEITNTEFRCTNGGEVVQAVYYINHGDDPELGLMFAWSNSYDRSQRFKCAVGAHVFVCGNGMMIGDMANYGKVHKGDKAQVLKNVTDHIEIQINSASNFYDMIKKDKEAMKNVCFTEKEMAEIMGVLYFQEDLLTSGQMIATKKEYEKPSHDYNAPLNSLWALYNHVTYSFKSSHPKKWMDTQANFHQFIAKTYIPKPVIDPNQMNITDVIETPDDQLITSEVTPNPLDNGTIECSAPEGFELNTPYDLPLGNDDMNSCPEDEEPKHGIPGTEGGHQFIPDSERAANEEAEMIKNEEIIEEKEEEDVFNAIADKVKPEVSEETSIIEESNNDLSFDNYFGEEPIDDDINLSDVNDIETELKTGSQEDHDEKVEEEEVIEEVVEESNKGKLELPDFEF